jgi:hypothetical protein
MRYVQPPTFKECNTHRTMNKTRNVARSDALNRRYDSTT